jgi:outer membrane biosynthesis protein TonB
MLGAAVESVLEPVEPVVGSVEPLVDPVDDPTVEPVEPAVEPVEPVAEPSVEEVEPTPPAPVVAVAPAVVDAPSAAVEVVTSSPHPDAKGTRGARPTTASQRPVWRRKVLRSMFLGAASSQSVFRRSLSSRSMFPRSMPLVRQFYPTRGRLAGIEAGERPWGLHSLYRHLWRMPDLTCLIGNWKVVDRLQGIRADRLLRAVETAHGYTHQDHGTGHR